MACPRARLVPICAPAFSTPWSVRWSQKTCQAVRQTGASQVQLAGGVAANRALRAQLRKAGEENDFEVFVPPPRRCTDNAVMIAAAGTHRLLAGHRSTLDLNADANLPLPG